MIDPLTIGVIVAVGLGLFNMWIVWRIGQILDRIIHKEVEL